MLDELPNEIIWKILNYLDINKIAILSTVNKKLNDIIKYYPQLQDSYKLYNLYINFLERKKNKYKDYKNFTFIKMNSLCYQINYESNGVDNLIEKFTYNYILHLKCKILTYSKKITRQFGLTLNNISESIYTNKCRVLD